MARRQKSCPRKMKPPTRLLRSRSRTCVRNLRATRKKKHDEHNRVIIGAERAANVYRDLIESVGEESEAPRDAPVVDFME